MYASEGSQYLVNTTLSFKPTCRRRRKRYRWSCHFFACGRYFIGGGYFARRTARNTSQRLILSHIVDNEIRWKYRIIDALITAITATHSLIYNKIKRIVKRPRILIAHSIESEKFNPICIIIRSCNGHATATPR